MKTKLLAATIFLLALVPAARFAWTSRDLPHLGLHDDDGIYWVGAKSLAQGSGYRILSLPDQSFQAKYPPLFSWFLSTPDFQKRPVHGGSRASFGSFPETEPHRLRAEADSPASDGRRLRHPTAAAS